MIRIHLSPPEYAHYRDLTNPPSVFRAKDDTPEGKRELKIKALESVIGFEFPRNRIGQRPFEVYGGRLSEEIVRWQ